jgi:hypothetical protein
MSEQDLLIEDIMERFGFCNCGCPEKALRKIRDILRLDHFTPETDEEHVIAYLLNKEDLLEHGGSVTYSWPTYRGEALLEELETLEL